LKTTVKFFLLFLLWPLLARAQNNNEWLPYGQFTEPAIKESSGFVKSRQFENLFWTHNDSGDLPRIFATTDKGELIRQVTIEGAKNVDWEDITTDDAGHLYLGDIGNNDNDRRDLSIYVIKEPDPRQASSAQVIKRIHFQYPDQSLFPDPQYQNFDSEALFWANGHLYLLTKHRSDRRTALYRFEHLQDDQRQTLTRLGDFEVDGMVTGADASVDGSKLLVLCYEYIYLFEKPRSGDNYLAGNFKRILLELRQSEGICFNEPYFFLTNEQREIYRLPVDYFNARDSFLPPLPSAVIPRIAHYKIDGKTTEWDGLTKSPVALKVSSVYEKNNARCTPPTVQIAWTEDGLVLLVRDWQMPKTKKKKKIDLLNVMLETNNRRTLALEDGAMVWKLSRTKKKLRFEQTFPPSSSKDSEPIYFLNETSGFSSLEAFLPIPKSLSPGDRLLFNIILNPFEECECYWASDTSMWSLANPYIWGEVELLSHSQ
jgi:hypothetical protein